ncbi:hypothetical protein CYMTET_32970, partial [Cymbomonas tetramitiformis]
MVSNHIKVAAVVGQVLFTSSIALVTHATKTNGEYAYNTLTVQLFSEIIKLLLSAFFLCLQYATDKEVPQVTLDPWRFAKAAIPAFLYFVSNNVNFFIIKELDAVAFQILNNIKILTTAVLFTFMMNATVSPLQWRMLFLLMAGSIMSQLGSCGGSMGGLKGSMMGYGMKLLQREKCAMTAAAAYVLRYGSCCSVRILLVNLVVLRCFVFLLGGGRSAELNLLRVVLFIPPG